MLTAVAVVIVARVRNRWVDRVLIAGLLASWPVSVLSHWLGGDLSLENGLPLQLCDAADFAGVIALWRRDRLAAELVYFFGLAGTLQGLITPNLQDDLPHPRFVSFFLTHSVIVIAALHVVLAMKLAPRPGAVGRMMVCILGWALAIGGLNALLHTNYGFLCHKPTAASLMDVLGPWPWYIAALVALAVLFFVILDLPFMIKRRRDQL
ncbi:MAG: hypothetical protein JWO08_807 [Verrucomicrobiaceae bacterium]|nr:hypothetical protein [Verrucomicrobiaceae bacterium]